MVILRILFLFWLGALLLQIGCCGSGFNSVKVGMKESDIRSLLGEPHRIETVTKDSSAVFKDDEVLSKHLSATLLIYTCRASRDLFVYLDSGGNVIKIVRTNYFDYTRN